MHPKYSAYLIHEGRFREAIDVELDCIRFGYHVMRGITMVEFQVGILIQSIAANDIRRLFLNENIPPEVLAYARDELTALAGQIPPIEKLITNLKAIQIAQLTDYYRGYITEFKTPNFPDTYKINYIPGTWWQRSMRFFRNFFRPLSDARSEISTFYDKAEALAKLPTHKRFTRIEELKNLARKIVDRNNDAAKFLGDPGPVFYEQARADVAINVALIMAALELYKCDTGAYPENIDALVPAYLTSIPIDAASGKPLLYRKEQDYCVVWSVGADGVNNGGDTTKRNSFSYIGGDTDYYFTNKKPEPEPFEWPPKYFYDN